MAVDTMAAVQGTPRDLVELTQATQTVLPPVLSCAPALAEGIGVSGSRAKALSAARKFLSPLLVGRVVATFVDHTGFFDGKSSFSARVRSSGTNDSEPEPSNPNPGSPQPDQTMSPPQTSPSKSVSLSKGASAQGQSGCSSSYCRFMVVKFKNFSGGSHTIKCRENGSAFYTYTRSGTSNTSSVCYYGFPGQKVSVTVDGVKSNTITW